MQRRKEVNSTNFLLIFASFVTYFIKYESLTKIDGVAKSLNPVTSAKAWVHKLLKWQDSSFFRNDEKKCFPTFYEAVKVILGRVVDGMILSFYFELRFCFDM